MDSHDTPRQLLVVEDNPTDTILLKRALSEHGVNYEMIVLEDGEEAVEYLDKDEGAREPDLIIVDLNLPKLDGIEVLKRYRSSSRFAETPVAILTSSDSPSERRRAENIGINAYLRKPIELDAFLALGATLRSLLETSAK
ncbi:MAG TPA: response regulator [Bryobacteraceae bacterium]|nr:response regulator [Bryobacteraceae bacterium]